MTLKHANQKQAGDARHTEMALLDLEQDFPSNGSSNLHHDIGKDSASDPAVIGGVQRDCHFGALSGIVKDPPQHCNGDRQLKDSEQNSLHSPKCSFQILTDRWISSGRLRGLNSQTIWQFEVRRVTSFSRTTSPAM